MDARLESPRASPQDVEAVLSAHVRAGKGRWTRRFAVIVVVGLAIGGGAYWLLGDGEPAMAYLTEPARIGDLTVVVTATGTVQPTNKVEISTELSGTVRKVLVDYNSPVEPGEVLAELDTERLEATLESSRAQLAAAEARVAEAQATIEEMLGNYERRQTLAERNVVSAQELALAQAAYERALAAHASAVAHVRVAQAEVQVNETNLSKACICSPISGIVLDRNIEPGQTVAASLQAPVLFTIAEDLSQMELQVDVDEADVGQTGVGQRASFMVDAYPGRRFPADIRDIRYAPEIVEGVVTYKAVLIIDNSERLLRPGMTATAEIVVQEVDEVLLVPNAALRFLPPAEEETGSSLSVLELIIPRPPRFRTASLPSPDGPDRVVWVLRDGIAAGVPVTVGQSDGRTTEIVSGDLSAGDPVITGMR